MGAQNNRQASDSMEQGIKRWQYGLAGLGAVLVAAYLVYFGVWLGQMPADDSEKWGQFGDFVGGLLNPVVAFAAFYWLTQSVKLQKTELAETRKALEASAQANQNQASAANVSVRLAALTALINKTQSRLSRVEKNFDDLDAKRPHQPIPAHAFALKYGPRLDGYRQNIAQLREESDGYAREIKNILSSIR